MLSDRLVSETELRSSLEEALKLQGYEVHKNSFVLSNKDRIGMREAHQIAREERLSKHIRILEKHFPKVKSTLLELKDIEISKIKPILIEVTSESTRDCDRYLWWNLVWWSLPYERAYGRQIRFIVWDDYHQAPMGLIGLQSPILKWKPRDDYLNIPTDTKDLWINQSMSAQRLGALPPYNKILGGKLIASLVASNDVRDVFKNKYKNKETLIEGRKIPANLLFVTTTGAFGKSSIYNRLKDWNGNYICKHIGETSGSGSFHIPSSIYEGLVQYLKEKGKYSGRYYGSGPSKKIKNIDVALRELGYKYGIKHGIKRSIYLFNFVSNIEGVINRKEKPLWINRDLGSLSDFWKKRWALNRFSTASADKLYFNKNEFFDEIEKQIEKCKLIK